MGVINAQLNVITAKSRFQPGSYVWFGQPNQIPDPDNPATLKIPYLDPELTKPASAIQGLDLDSKFEQTITGFLYGSGLYSIRVMTAADNTGTQLYYIPEVAVTATINELGTAAYADVATEAEALAGTSGVLPDAKGVKDFVGQFGLGLPNAGANTFTGDLNTLRNQQEVYVLSSGSGNLPVNLNGYLKVTPSSINGFVLQEYTVGFGSAYGGRKFTRIEDNTRGGWQAWSEVHTTANGASNAEALAGTDNTKWMSPLRTSEAIDAKLSTFTVADDSHNHSSATITSISSAVAGAAIAGLSAGAVGSYAWLRHTSDTTSIVYGSSYSASVLRTSGINVFLSGDANQQGSGSGISVSGTWMAVGSCDSIGGSLTYAATIFKRIS